MAITRATTWEFANSGMPASSVPVSVTTSEGSPSVHPQTGKRIEQRPPGHAGLPAAAQLPLRLADQGSGTAVLALGADPVEPGCQAILIWEDLLEVVLAERAALDREDFYQRASPAKRDAGTRSKTPRDSTAGTSI
jgi:hypothetical protein